MLNPLGLSGEPILDGSITANTSKADAQDNVEFESAAKGWGSESWSEE